MDARSHDRKHAPVPELKAWLAETRQDIEYTGLALAALRGDEDARAELRYKFPWADQGPLQRWAEISSLEVQRLVEFALTDSEDIGVVAQLRRQVDLRNTMYAANHANGEHLRVLTAIMEES